MVDFYKRCKAARTTFDDAVARLNAESRKLDELAEAEGRSGYIILTPGPELVAPIDPVQLDGRVWLGVYVKDDLDGTKYFRHDDPLLGPIYEARAEEHRAWFDLEKAKVRILPRGWRGDSPGGDVDSLKDLKLYATYALWGVKDHRIRKSYPPGDVLFNIDNALVQWECSDTQEVWSEPKSDDEAYRAIMLRIQWLKGRIDDLNKPFRKVDAATIAENAWRVPIQLRSLDPGAAPSDLQFAWNDARLTMGLLIEQIGEPPYEKVVSDDLNVTKTVLLQTLIGQLVDVWASAPRLCSPQAKPFDRQRVLNLANVIENVARDLLAASSPNKTAVPGTADGAQGAGANNDEPQALVKLNGKGQSPTVCGKPVGVLTAAYYSVVEALVEAGPDGLDHNGITRIKSEAPRYLKTLVGSRKPRPNFLTAADTKLWRRAIRLSGTERRGYAVVYE